jgi:hypothetical protein
MVSDPNDPSSQLTEGIFTIHDEHRFGRFH